jgi:hypothetical protein
LQAIPGGDADYKVEIDSDKSQEVIKFETLLSVSFKDHIPPSEDELKTWHMTKELWQELQTVSTSEPRKIPLLCLLFNVNFETAGCSTTLGPFAP